MEDKDGNRFTIPSRSVETQRPLKMINPNYHYYMGGTWLHTFDPYKRPITEIISKWGDYTLCNKQEGSYTFPYLTHVSGISRGHSVTLLTEKELSPEADVPMRVRTFSVFCSSTLIFFH